MNLRQMIKLNPGSSVAERLDDLPLELIYGDDAASRLAESLRAQTDMSSILVFFDRRTRSVAGRTCLEALRAAGWTVRECLVPDTDAGLSPVCNENTVRELRSNLPPAEVYLAVGSGVINDVTKWLAAEEGKPYAVFATAASMNGYASANVATEVNHVKSLFFAKAPVFMAADPAIIENAPFELTTAGLGDVLAKPVSTADWAMNHQLFAEPFSEDIAAIINRVESSYIEHPEAILARDPTAILALLQALVLSGCAMTLQGSSNPASGGEHLISHTLDMKSGVEGKKHDLHGRQVGVTTIFAAALYERILNMDNPAFVSEPMGFDVVFWSSIADCVKPHYDLAVKRTSAAIDILRQPGVWDKLRCNIGRYLRSPAMIKHCLKKAGAAHRLTDIGFSREDFILAVRNATSMRERFTSVDLAFAVGLLPKASEEIIEEWL